MSDYKLQLCTDDSWKQVKPTEILCPNKAAVVLTAFDPSPLLKYFAVFAAELDHGRLWDREERGDCDKITGCSCARKKRLPLLLGCSAQSTRHVMGDVEMNPLTPVPSVRSWLQRPSHHERRPGRCLHSESEHLWTGDLEGNPIKCRLGL